MLQHYMYPILLVSARRFKNLSIFLTFVRSQTYQMTHLDVKFSDCTGTYYQMKFR